MNQFESLKKRARENAVAAEYLDSLSSKLAREIFKMRMERGLTQQELADLASTTQKTISRIEAGDPGVKIGTYDKVLFALKENPFQPEHSEEANRILATVWQLN